MKTRIIPIILVLCMLFTLVGCTGDGTKDDSSNGSTAELDSELVNLDGTLPIIKDPDAFEEKYGKLSMYFITNPQRIVETEDLAMVKKWEEDTGIRFDWETVPSEGAQEKINLMLTSGSDLPDAFWNFGDGRSGNMVVQYADQGVFLPTESLINEEMPNLKKILDESDNYWAEITAPDGHTYGFPYIEEMFGLVLTPGPFEINEKWLEKVGHDMPTTVDEWVDALIAFRDYGDLNENGLDDEVILATTFSTDDTFGSYNMFYRFTGAFGMADSYCMGNEYADHLRLVDGKVTFTAMDDAFRKTANFFNDLYNEELIWDNAFDVATDVTFSNSLLNQDIALVGTFGVWGDQEVTNFDVRQEYKPLPRLTGEAGQTGFALNYSECQDSSNTAITTDCKYPILIAKFVDYMVGDPAISIQSNWGAVGYNYYLDEDTGVLRFPLDDRGNIISVPPYEGFGEMRANSTTARGSMVVLNEYYDTVAEYAYDAANLLAFQRANGKDEILDEYDTIPKVLMTTEELSRLAQIQPTISDIVDRYVIQWVLNGDADTTFDAYVSELKAAGVEELVEIYQGAVDRASK